MAKYYGKRRKIYNVKDDSIEKIGNIELNKVLKPNINTNQQYGSGKIPNYNGRNLNRSNIKLPHIKAVEEYVLKSIIAQDEHVKRIITAIYRGKKFKSIKSNILIIGSSGTGKTATVVEIAKRLNLPYTIEDATKYTKEGYYGADVNEMIYNLLDNADQNVELAQRGIIIIDEIDKKASHGENDVSGAEVLKSLLKIIEGTTVKVPSNDMFEDTAIEFDTTNLIIIFCGAFSGLEKIRDKRLNKHSLGFSDSEKEEKKEESKYLKEDLVKYGMPEEFVGRIDTIVEMNKLTKTDLAKILRKSRLSIFRRYQTELKNEGISLEYDGKLFELIAEESLALDTGARELSNTVNRIFENISYNIFSNPKRYTKCKLHLDIVKDNTKNELS